MAKGDNPGYYSGIEFKGLDEIERKLKLLPEAVKRKYARNAMKTGAEIVRDRAAQLARRAIPTTRPEFGPIADNIVVKMLSRASLIVATVGINWLTHSYGHLIEFGHDTKHGKTKAYPFMRPAFDEKAEAALDKILTDLRDAVEIEVSNGG